MAPDDFNLDEFLPYRLAVAAADVSREFGAIYRERFGLTIPEWRVLAHLSQGREVSVGEIAHRVGMDKSKVSRAAARLETAGRIARRESATDRRRANLSLTDSGRALMDELAPLALEFEARIADRLGHDPEAFRAALARLSAQGAASKLPEEARTGPD